MTDEAGFLTHLLANPADRVARLAFADWLEEQGDPTSLHKANFIRLEDEFMDMPYSPSARLVEAHLREMALTLHHEWKRAVSRVRIEAPRTNGANCPEDCPRDWDQLEPNACSLAVRDCRACSRQVVYCKSVQEAQYVGLTGRRVALDLAVTRSPGDLLVNPLLTRTTSLHDPHVQATLQVIRALPPQPATVTFFPGTRTAPATPPSIRRMERYWPTEPPAWGTFADDEPELPRPRNFLHRLARWLGFRG